LELKWIARMNALEKKRRALAPSLAASLGLSEAEPTLAALIAALSPEDGAVFRELRTRLRGLADRQLELNKLTGALLETQFEYADAVMNVMMSADDSFGSFYDEDGRSADGRFGHGFFEGQV
ncbi:MAG: flagellar protein FlgN, partial [Oscillospiraceae bacterium]|nr:flagellar protein FlgN [Oscillospiraceae bacterium]